MDLDKPILCEKCRSISQEPTNTSMYRLRCDICFNTRIIMDLDKYRETWPHTPFRHINKYFGIPTPKATKSRK